MTTELLPCPFCGGEARHLEFRAGYHGERLICDSCDFYLSPQNWQARAALAATPAPAQPLSDDQIDDLMPTNTSMPRSDALRWMARAVERAHDCAAAIRSGK